MKSYVIRNGKRKQRSLHSDILYIGGSDLCVTFRKELRIAMISYNNNDYDKKSRRKQVRRRRTFHRAVCIILCLFMGAAVFGAVSLISVGKEASPPGKRSAENTGGFSQMNGR